MTSLKKVGSRGIVSFSASGHPVGTGLPTVWLCALNPRWRCSPHKVSSISHDCRPSLLERSQTSLRISCLEATVKYLQAIQELRFPLSESIFIPLVGLTDEAKRSSFSETFGFPFASRTDPRHSYSSELQSHTPVTQSMALCISDKIRKSCCTSSSSCIVISIIFATTHKVGICKAGRGYCLVLP